MKFKTFLEDFVVEEVLKKGVLKEKGLYKVYKAKKIGLESFYLKNLLEKTFNAKISFLGLKDKKSISIFYFSAKGNVPNYVKFKNFSAELIGFSDKELNSYDLEKNNFKITLRDLRKNEVGKIFEILEDLKKKGFPNYFDIQRLSSDASSLFFPLLIKGNIKEAIKVHLLSLSPEGRKNLKRFKKYVKKFFYKPERLLPYAPSEEDREIVKKLIEDDCKGIIKKIESDLLKIYFEKFSSLIWNKCVSKFLKKSKISFKKGFVIKIKNIFLFVPETINQEVKDILSEPIFPVPGIERIPSHPEFEEILIRELKKDNLSYPLKVPDFLENFSFRGYTRRLWVYPEDLNFNYDKEKLILSFSLPPGSYATILLKILMRKLNL
ncbi:MAG: tRNA pseudouridine(13) synthase TruD [candidate division WOR-3 bacterium]